MKISQIRDDYLEASGKVSELVRQLTYAGIGVIWVLRIGAETGGIRYFDSLKLPLLFFVISLTLDLLQYVYKTILLYYLNKHFFGMHQNNDQEVDYSRSWNLPTQLLFWSKTGSTVIAYAGLIIFLLAQF